MKIIVLSDIHGNSLVLNDLQKSFDFIKPDKIIFLGDLFGYYYNYIEIINFFKVNEVECILGNHDVFALDILLGKVQNNDHYILKYGQGYNFQNKFKHIYLDYLLSKPKKIEIEINSKKILFVHGSPSDHLNGRIYPDTDISFMEHYSYDIVFCGHTHHRFMAKSKKNILINVGSVGQPRDGFNASFFLYEEKPGNDLFVFKEVNFNKEQLSNQVIKNKDNDKPYFNIINRKPKYLR